MIKPKEIRVGDLLEYRDCFFPGMNFLGLVISRAEYFQVYFAGQNPFSYDENRRVAVLEFADPAAWVRL